jgi:hypothetical protein
MATQKLNISSEHKSAIDAMYRAPRAMIVGIRVIYPEQPKSTTDNSDDLNVIDLGEVTAECYRHPRAWIVGNQVIYSNETQH